MDSPILNCDRPGDADVVLITAGYDRTSSFAKGADRGPAAILECLRTQIEVYDRVSDSAPGERLRIATVSADGLGTLAPEAMVESLRREYERHPGAFRVLIGGEHSVSNAAFLAHADRAAEITIVQIDAHADLREDDSDYNDDPWGRYAHCAVMKRAWDLGFHLVQVGVRAYSAEENARFAAARTRVFEWSSAPPSVATILSAIPTEQVYLTLDADGLDPACMPATGTPVPGGLSWYDTLELLDGLTRAHRLVGADVVEVCPRPGDVRTEYAAAQLMYSLLGLALCRG